MSAKGYTAKLGREICSDIANGSSLRATCDRLQLPRRTVRGWLSEYPEFERMYERARRLQVDDFADEIVEIADSVRESDSQAKVQAAKLAIDTRKWICAKLLPQRFGDQLALTGAEGRDLIPAEPDITKLALLLMNIFEDACVEDEAPEVLSNHPPAVAPPLPAGEIQRRIERRTWAPPETGTPA